MKPIEPLTTLSLVEAIARAKAAGFHGFAAALSELLRRQLTR